MAKAKLDTTKIKDFDKLSEETKKFLTDFEYEVPEADYTGYVKKDIFDKKASEVASLEKKLRDKMSEEEQKAADNAKILEELEWHRKDKKVSALAKEYVALGYSSDLASATAQAKVDGQDDVVLANHKKFLEEYKAEIERKALGGTPSPKGGTPPTPPSGNDDDLSDEEYFKKHKI